MANKEQLQAIQHINGPMMVIAGPGSGKTYTITKRLIYMTANNILPENILVITFTKAAATEMRKRYENESDTSKNTITFGTFHSVFLNILKDSNIYNNISIISDIEKYKIMDNIISYQKNQSQQKYCCEYINSKLIFSELSKIKNEGIDINTYKSDLIDADIFKTIHNEYSDALKACDKIDFDDILCDCYKLLNQNKEILNNYREHYKYIVIDEFQDINPIQFKIIKLIAAPENNLFIVGDDDQAIYKFRGSRPDIMLGFKNIYPDAKTVILHTNYRSTENIVNTSLSFISKNTKRFNKKLSTASETKIPVNCKGYDSKSDEYKDILQIIKTIKRKKSYKDIAIIYRTNNSAIYLTKELVKNNIPYIFTEKHKSLSEHPITEDILSIFKFVYKEPLRKYLLRFLNKPNRFIPRNIFEDTNVHLDTIILKKCHDLSCKSSLIKLKQDLSFIKKECPYIAFDYILMHMDYKKYALNKYSINNDKTEVEEVLQTLKDLFKGFNNYKDIENFMNDYKTFNLVNASNINDKDKINIMTMHSSKGLEFDTVILPDLNEGYIPSKKCKTNDDIEEERRVFYVAMTRAKNSLYLKYLNKSKENHKEKSRFLEEIKIM